MIKKNGNSGTDMISHRKVPLVNFKRKKEREKKNMWWEKKEKREEED